MPTIIPGQTTFRALIADCNALWKVIKARGKNTWDCVVIEPDHLDTKKVFGGEEIARAIAIEHQWKDLRSEDDMFWDAQPVGAVLHYYNGFGKFVRGEVVVDPTDGRKKLCPKALVGNWNPQDVPHYLIAGRLYVPYHAQKIKAGDAWRPHYSCIYEHTPQKCKDDPREMWEIDLTPPPTTPEIAERARLHTLISEVQKLMHGVADDEAIKRRLRQARDLLNEADL